jgi:hypothetical protein
VGEVREGGDRSFFCAPIGLYSPIGAGRIQSGSLLPTHPHPGNLSLGDKFQKKIIRHIRMIFISNSEKWILGKIPGSGSAGSVAILALECFGVQGGYK